MSIAQNTVQTRFPMTWLNVLAILFGTVGGVIVSPFARDAVERQASQTRKAEQLEPTPIAVKSDGSPLHLASDGSPSLVSSDGSPIRIRPDVATTSTAVTLPLTSPGVTEHVPEHAPKPDAHLAKWAAEEVKILKSEDKTKFEAFRWRNRAANRTEIDDFLAWFAAEFGSLPIRVNPDPLPPSIANKK